MTIDFYKCTDDIRTAVKTFTDKKTITGASILGAVSVLQPVFILEYDGTLLGYQYMYVADLGHWYYISNRVLNNAGQIIISGQADMLSTYPQILDCTGQAVRTGGNATMVPDAAYPVDPSRENVTSLLFDSGDLDPPAVLPEYPYRFILTMK